MSEDRLWSWLRGRLPPGHYQRVENHACGPGTPDVNFCVDAVEAWMELKYRAGECRPDTIAFRDGYGLRPDQKIWIRDRVEAGGKVTIVAGVGHYIHFLPGRYAMEFNRLTYRELRNCTTYRTIDRRKPPILTSGTLLALVSG